MSRLARVFGSGENPLRWAVPLYRAAGIDVRVHVFFIVYVLVDLVVTLRHGALGVGHRALTLAGLFGLVLLHEYGHCFACRRRGGEADEIILWPLGGLASCRPPHDWLSYFITTAGGPAVNLALLLPLGGAAWAATGDAGAAVFNLFDPGAAFLAAGSSSTLVTWLQVAVIGTHVANTYLLLFNALMPMYPLDGGRMLHALLWRSLGFYKATEAATLVGMITAGVLAVVGLVTDASMLLGIALFGGVVCFQERRAARFADTGGQEDALAESRRIAADEAKARARARREREADAQRQAEVDRILAKIAREGMGSLTRGEKRTLEEASEARRGPR